MKQICVSKHFGKCPDCLRLEGAIIHGDREHSIPVSPTARPSGSTIFTKKHEQYEDAAMMNARRESMGPE